VRAGESVLVFLSTDRKNNSPPSFSLALDSQSTPVLAKAFLIILRRKKIGRCARGLTKECRRLWLRQDVQGLAGVISQVIDI
jgi:hypothetical protein